MCVFLIFKYVIQQSQMRNRQRQWYRKHCWMNLSKESCKQFVEGFFVSVLYLVRFVLPPAVAAWVVTTQRKWEMGPVEVYCYIKVDLSFWRVLCVTNCE